MMFSICSLILALVVVTECRQLFEDQNVAKELTDAFHRLETRVAEAETKLAENDEEIAQKKQEISDLYKIIQKQEVMGSELRKGDCNDAIFCQGY